MTIRTRLTVWYAGILFVFTAVIAALTYHELVIEKKKPGETNETQGFGEAIGMLLCIGVPSAVIGIGGGWFLMRKALGPISALTLAASKFHDRNLHERLQRSGNGDEIDRLTEVFNQMLTRLEDSFQQIREFTLHASHELKTPLTIMSGELETALREKNLTERQQERIISQIEEIQRLAKIVDGLTLLTKAGAGQLQLKREPLNFTEMVQEAYEDAQILAQADKITVSLEKCDEVILLGDRHRLRQVLLNVFDNAIKYNQPDGKVSIQLICDQKESDRPVAELTVSNTGPGIPPEKISRVFEPFFRCDLSHGTSVDGCGLGLSICHVIVSSHSGKIHLRSNRDTSTILTIVMPSCKKNK